MSSYRLSPRPGEVIDRSRSLHFNWNGKSHLGHPGDTIASALAADGIRVLSRSFKYHRRRGLLTADYHDPNALVQVGNEPNVRAAHRRLAEGMQVGAQNAWPSVSFDIKAATGRVGRFLSPGFYYKTFMRPQRLWPWYQKVLRRFSAGGAVSARTDPSRFDHRYAHPDVLVAGGGPAGMAAAIAAADVGVDVLLVEEEPELGGHLRWSGSDALTTLEDLRTAVAGHTNIEVLTDSVVTGRYDHNWVGVAQYGLEGIEGRLVMARAKSLVVAAGQIERPYVFAGNDLPGVMLSGAVRRLINLYAVKPADRAVIFTANSSGDAAAADLADAGVDVVAMVDARKGHNVVRAIGRKGVGGIELADGRRISADLLVTATGWTTPTSLLNMAGDRPAYEPRAARFLPQSLPDDVLATGGILGDGTTEELVAHGKAVGTEAGRRAAVVRARWQTATPGASVPAPVDHVPVAVPPLPAAEHPELFRSTTHGFVDMSEDISSQDLFSAAAEGYDSIELLKRYTTVTMGPAQGKLETVNAVAILAEATQRTIADTGTTTWRPPHAPVTLGALAGRNHEPVRHSAMQPWHETNGAVPLVAGQWIRPDRYGDPAEEVRNVRSRVGIIDVSPLGKIDLRGTDVPGFLEFVYTNRWSKLDIGRVRYGVMCAEDGVVFDDGVTGRLSENRYLMTTTSGGAGRVWNWLDEWLQTEFTESDVKMTAVTDGLASINVAGPRSRELLTRLVDDVDLDPDAFEYMNVRLGTVAGVPECILWRIGFTGELSYELHIPAGFGLYVWEALLSEGRDLGVAPFGVEAQRIMRLEKGHLIVGQDTDGLTQGFSAGLEWAIKLDKSDFAGKPELVWQSERDDYMRLVALQPLDPQLLPTEASQIIAGDRSIKGRITSSRMSPSLERSICLGLVDPELSTPGSVVTVLLSNGRLAPARVMEHHAHFDPEGVRLRG
ncbi:MAG: 2Fe-2S iron-sulfur cluster-binding protein [Acidimicrobiia bacterium]